MSFGINKCATIVVKPVNFNKPPRYEDPTFYIGMHSIPKVTCYTYLGIAFDEDLSLKPILSNMYKKVNYSLYSLRNFLLNNSIPIGLRKIIIQSFIISKVLYYAPFLGSNKNRTSRIQFLLNTGMLWSINSLNRKNNFSKDKKTVKYERNSYMSLYALSIDFKIPPLASICEAQQIKCFIKWRKSNCIIKDLIRNIPKLSHYSWTKESRSLHEKLKKKNIKNTDEIKEEYWLNNPLNNGRKPLDIPISNSKIKQKLLILVLKNLI